MKLRELSDKLSLEQVCGPHDEEREVTRCYAGDILSDVMAHAPDGCIWLTLQTHGNIVAVASLKEMAGIILVNGHRPDEETVAKAEAEAIPLFVTTRTCYETAGMLYRMGIVG